MTKTIKKAVSFKSAPKIGSAKSTAVEQDPESMKSHKYSDKSFRKDSERFKSKEAKALPSAPKPAQASAGSLKTAATETPAPTDLEARLFEAFVAATDPLFLAFKKHHAEDLPPNADGVSCYVTHFQKPLCELSESILCGKLCSHKNLTEAQRKAIANKRAKPYDSKVTRETFLS
jgi:hypothetical protein